MGVPKFYQWISERYPCLSEKIKEFQIPEFDNAYLDMNGIIHACSHPNDDDIHLRIPESSIFRDVFRYIEFLFKLIKPRKVFFMAIDGVAPRAKMNQQRGRRFRSARLAEEQESEAIRKGEKLPTEERFDSNCITPGTEFMARLHEHLKYFVQVKVSTDPLWQRKGLVIYLSGHDVPGEGEHKIMDFIRHIRSKPDYNAESTHCLYGLDADLIMLGLSTHELKFSLLREEVKFNRPKRREQRGKKDNQANSSTRKETDLSNLSVFRADDSVVNVNAKEVMGKAPPGELGSATFANLVKTGTAPPGINKESVVEDSQTLVPPPPDSSTATGTYRITLPEKMTFYLLHLSLLRDYIDEEFSPLRKDLENHTTMKYDLESIIDDWILMGILVGNDFVPNLPHFHINKGALPMIYQTYMEVLPQLDGYLNEAGILNLRRFEIFIRRLSQYDLDVFRETYDDMKYMESKTGKNIVLGEKMFEDFDFDDAYGKAFDEEELEPAVPLSLKLGLQELIPRTEESIFACNDDDDEDENGQLCKDVFSDDEELFADDTQEFRLEFFQNKRNYYSEKVEIMKVNKAAVRDFAKEYIRAIQWVLLYYYKGVSSWGWYFPSHYAPYASDLRHFSHYDIQFEKGDPFRPFQQLLAVLPSQSKRLLPHCFQWLMTEANSPILHFYPSKFLQDLNGKKQDWEAVVLIPFIDEGKLIESMDKELSKLSNEEMHRNSRGNMLCYSACKEETGPILSPGTSFPELQNSHYTLDKVYELLYNPELLPKGVHSRAMPHKIYQGFPSLKSIPHKSSLSKEEIKVFDFLSKEDSLIIDMRDNEEPNPDKTWSTQLLGKMIWVNWPHLTLACVTNVMTRDMKYSMDEYSKRISSNYYSAIEFASATEDLRSQHLKFKGIMIGSPKVYVMAKLMEGRKIRCQPNGTVVIENQWSVLERPYSLKTAIIDEDVIQLFRIDSSTMKSFRDVFRVEDEVFVTSKEHMGSFGVVKGYEGKNLVLVDLYDNGNVSFNSWRDWMRERKIHSMDYQPSYTAASECKIDNNLFNRITGALIVDYDKEPSPKKNISKNNAESGSRSDSEEEFPPLARKYKSTNVGLNLKFNKKNLEVRGYTKRVEQRWLYSAKTIALVKDFVKAFPVFVRRLTSLAAIQNSRDNYKASDFFNQDGNKRLNEMVEWLEKRGIHDLHKVPHNSNILDDEDINLIWTAVLKMNESRSPATKQSVCIKVTPNQLYKPGLDSGCVEPVMETDFKLLDRVVCVDMGCPVPLGQRGTIIGIQKPTATKEVEDAIRSTSATSLPSYVVLCDPIVDVFDKSIDGEKATSKKAENLTVNLACLLGINGGTKKPTELANRSSPPPKQKLLNFYAYQILKLKCEVKDEAQPHKLTRSKTISTRVQVKLNPNASAADIKVLTKKTLEEDLKNLLQTCTQSKSLTKSNDVSTLSYSSVVRSGTGDKMKKSWPPQPPPNNDVYVNSQIQKERKIQEREKPKARDTITTSSAKEKNALSVLNEAFQSSIQNVISKSAQPAAPIKPQGSKSSNSQQTNDLLALLNSSRIQKPVANVVPQVPQPASKSKSDMDSEHLKAQLQLLIQPKQSNTSTVSVSSEPQPMLQSMKIKSRKEQTVQPVRTQTTINDSILDKFKNVVIEQPKPQTEQQQFQALIAQVTKQASMQQEQHQDPQKQQEMLQQQEIQQLQYRQEQQHREQIQLQQQQLLHQLQQQQLILQQQQQVIQQQQQQHFIQQQQQFLQQQQQQQPHHRQQQNESHHQPPQQQLNNVQVNPARPAPVQHSIAHQQQQQLNRPFVQPVQQFFQNPMQQYPRPFFVGQPGVLMNNNFVVQNSVPLIVPTPSQPIFPPQPPAHWTVTGPAQGFNSRPQQASHERGDKYILDHTNVPVQVFRAMATVPQEPVLHSHLSSVKSEKPTTASVNDMDNMSILLDRCLSKTTKLTVADCGTNERSTPRDTEKETVKKSRRSMGANFGVSR